MTERQGLFSIPTRLLLTPEQRARLEAIVRARQVDLTELLSAIVADYLADQPDVPVIGAPSCDTSGELRKRRADLARLRARHAISGDPPTWLAAYIAQLEAEIRRLEGEAV